MPFLFFYSTKNPEKSITVLSLIIIRNFLEHKISMWSSEGSCDTEDWSNDAENSALRHRNKLHFKIYYNRKHSFEVSVCFCSLQEFENTEGQADLSTLASPSSQNDPEVYILPLTEVSLPVSKQPSKSCKNLYVLVIIYL